MNADGSDRRLILEQAASERIRTLKLSPDRRCVVYAMERNVESVRVVSFKEEHLVRVLNLETGKTSDLVAVQGGPDLFWSADGTAVYGSGTDHEAEEKNNEKGVWYWLNWRVDLDTKTFHRLDTPNEYRAWGVTPTDGKLIYTRHLPPIRRENGVTDWPVETAVSPADVFTPKVVIPATALVEPLAVFPDGRRWMVRIGAGRFGVYTQGESESKAWDWQVKAVGSATIAPDGERVIVTYAPFVRFDEETGLRSYLPDGTGGVQVWDSRAWVSSVDWR